jgi:hypothetical protein
MYGTCPFCEEEITEVNLPALSSVIVEEQLQFKLSVILSNIPLQIGNLAKKSDNIFKGK